MKIWRLRPRRTLGLAVARAIVLNRVHCTAEFDIVIVGIVEIAGDVAAGLAIAQRRLAIVAHRTVVRYKARLLRLRRKWFRELVLGRTPRSCVCRLFP
jgi:hypothetical protein